MTPTRTHWTSLLTRLATPVLSALAERRLAAAMPVESTGTDRATCTRLEALARTLAGLAPWLELAAPPGPSHDPAAATLADLARLSIAAIVDHASPDHVPPSCSNQTVVDAAFLAHAILRAPTQLFAALPAPTRTHLITYWLDTRQHAPPNNNWLLFSALIEAALHHAGEKWDPMRVDYALRQHQQWYKGDGHYGDGPHFHADYYNSFVIHPMLLDLLRHTPATPERTAFQPLALARAQRYAAVQERMIAPDGTFPPLGRSLTYRGGAFQLLAQLALQQTLPPELSPAQVRTALTAVITRTLAAPNTFTEKNFLTIGLSGPQPALGEPYISTGSLYLCTTAFLPLGLPPTNPFWSDPDAPTTQQKIWSGQNTPTDHALHDQ